MKTKTRSQIGKCAANILLNVVQKGSVERKEISKTMMILCQAGLVSIIFVVGSTGVLRYFISATSSGIKIVTEENIS